VSAIVIKLQSASVLTHANVINNKKFMALKMAREKNLSAAVLDVTGVFLYFTKSLITFWATLIQIYYLYGSESFYLLLNFENHDSGRAGKCYSEVYFPQSAVYFPQSAVYFPRSKTW
jgi:hypothetical protein